MHIHVQIKLNLRQVIISKTKIKTIDLIISFEKNYPY